MKAVKDLINILAGMLLGMCFMGWFFCRQLNITSGPMYIDPVVLCISVLSVVCMKVLVHLDPSFKE